MKQQASFTFGVAYSKYLFAGLYILLFVLYAAVAYQSYGYDDEFFNINLIEKLGFGAVGHLQHADIHPPLSYAINAGLYSLLGNWSLVRLFSGLLVAAALIAVTHTQRKQFGNDRALVVFLLLALNPAILMWCTGVRWYAYFFPILLYLVFQPVRSGIKGWALVLVAITVLGYLEYSIFLVIIPVLLLSWIFSDDTVQSKLKYLLYLIPVFLVLYSYQLYIFFTVHLGHKGRQVSHSPVANLQGYSISQVSNQGVFPISIPAVLSVVGFAGISFCIVKYLLNGTNNKTARAVVIVYMIAAASLIIVGVAWKPRNLILLIPFQVFLIAYYYGLLRHSKMYIGSVLLIAVANVCGCINVLLHEDTTKNSWNLPVKETLTEIAGAGKNDSSLVVFTHDPTLTYILRRNGYRVVFPVRQEKAADYSSIKTAIFINTYRGTISKPVYDSLIAEEYSIRGSASKAIKIGRDKYYKWKRKMAEEYPEYQVEMIVYTDPKQLSDLLFWNGRRGFVKLPVTDQQ